MTEIVTHIFETVGQTHVSLLGLQRLVLRLTEIMQLALRTASQDRETITVPPPAVNNILDIEALKNSFSFITARAWNGLLPPLSPNTRR